MSWDTEAKDARALKGRMTDLEKTLAEHRQAIALAEQKAGTDQAAITDLKAQITSLKDDHKSEISSLKIEHRQAMDEFKQAQANEKQDLIDTHRQAWPTGISSAKTWKSPLKSWKHP